MYVNVHMNSGETANTWIDALSASFAGVQVNKESKRFNELHKHKRWRYMIERFSYDLEMKAREQNRNNKRKEIERFGWFIERTDKRAWLFIG